MRKLQIIKRSAHWALRIITATVNVLCILIGTCTILYQLGEFKHADLRVEENTEAVDEVTKLGLFVEAHFLRTGHIPSLKEFNCPTPCNSDIYIVTHEAWQDGNGVIHAKYFKPGLAFTPLSQFNIYWNSATRTTDREIYKNRWVWLLAPMGWLVVGATLVALPFFIGAAARKFMRRTSIKTNSA